MDEQILAHRIAWANACDTYPQTQGKLRTAEGFCCLGVVEDIRLKSFGIEDGWRKSDEQSGDPCFGIGTTALEFALLTPAGRAWLGYDDITENVACTTDQLLALFPQLAKTYLASWSADSAISFIEMNDDLNLTLPQIAQVIRAYHLG